MPRKHSSYVVGRATSRAAFLCGLIEDFACVPTEWDTLAAEVRLHDESFSLAEIESAIASLIASGRIVRRGYKLETR
jgi:hypothetical protein